MHDPNDHLRPLRVGSLFSGYGGLDLAVERVFDAETIWFSENNKHVARVFSHHWPDAPNLGDITQISWGNVPPVDVLCGGSRARTYRRSASGPALPPAPARGCGRTWPPRSTCCNRGSSSSRTYAGCCQSPAVRAPTEGDEDDHRNPDPATPGAATLRNLEPDPWGLGDIATRPLRAAGAVLGDLADLRYDTQWIGLPASLVGAPHPRFRIFILAAARTLFRTPLATDSTRGGESLDQVRARRGTIALSHQIIDLALNGPHGSASNNDESEMLWSLVEGIFIAGDATPTPSPNGHTSPDDQRRHRRS